MPEVYGRDLDLNLLRVFVVVAEEGSVTRAASRLYLTQPAISAALRRLTDAVGAPLFVRAGRGLSLTARGRGLREHAGPHLRALVQAALAPESGDWRQTERTLRIGLSDTNELWLLPSLLARLQREAPGLRIIVLPVQFRTVGEVLRSAQIDLAVTVADELPSGVNRQSLFVGDFVCLHDPRYSRLGARISHGQYFEREHVIVSYNGDLRGIVEDLLRLERKVRVSIPSFQAVGSIVHGTPLLATVPRIVARQTLRSWPKLRASELPFTLTGTPMELIWRAALDDDPALRFVREVITEEASRLNLGSSRRSRPRATKH